MGKLIYLDFLVEQKTEHKGPGVLSGLIEGIRYLQRRGRNLRKNGIYLLILLKVQLVM